MPRRSEVPVSPEFAAQPVHPRSEEPLQVQAVVNGLYEENCYIASIGDTCIVVDPGDEADRILDAIGDKHVQLVVCTHAHWDHIGAVNEIVEETGAPFAIGSLEVQALNDPRLNGSLGVRRALPKIHVDQELVHNEQLILTPMQFRVIEGVGHSLGHITLYGHGVLFSGDTLFNNAIGRIDFPGSVPHMMPQTLAALARLPHDTVVYPGHGPATTIGEELKHNVRMKMMLDLTEGMID